jgi:thiol:disulfide interchange protein
MKKVQILAAVLLFAALVYPQIPGETPVQWKGSGPGIPVQPGGVFEVKLEASISGDWHLYSATQAPGGPNPTKFSLTSGEPFKLTGKIRQVPPPTTQFDQNFGIDTEFFSQAAEFNLAVESGSNAKAGEYALQLQAVYQVCDDKVCLPPARVKIPVKVTIGGAAAGPVAAKAPPSSAPKPEVAPNETVQQSEPVKQEPQPAPAAVASPAQPAAAPVAEPESRTPSGTAAEVQKARAGGFLPFLWLAMTMGGLSLATPCVFPMIPITVSYFTKSAESHRGSGVKKAFVYSLGIVATFTGLGLGLAAVLGATGINQFAANPWLNLLITAVFLSFALNLFGLYQIGVPSSVLTRLSKMEGGGYAQVLLMGLTFTLTSFTCTVPFVGTVLVATSQGDWLWPALGMLGFSVVFAAPFFVLALIPSMLTSLPRSGGWLNSVKVTMGFLEVAAAMKFISNVDLVWNWRIFTREVVLSVWIAVAVLATIYLLGKIQLPHDSPVESLGVLRMVSAMIFLTLGFYLFTGLIGGSLGELDAFLPPRTAGGLALTGSGSPGQELTWHMNLEPALAQARRERKPVFVDFTGYTCTNCRWMEANIFPRPEIHSELQRFVRLQLYTDGTGKQYEENQRYQKEKYGTVALPLYVILDADGNKLATFPGMTRKPDEFLAFLRGRTTISD